jgi:hypothetical protein
MLRGCFAWTSFTVELIPDPHDLPIQAYVGFQYSGLRRAIANSVGHMFCNAKFVSIGCKFLARTFNFNPA